MTVFNASIHDPDSPTSLGRYSLVLDESRSTYVLTIQLLADNPRERDWRTEFRTLSGSFVREGELLHFRVEAARSGVRSSAWQGRVDESPPFPAFEGTLRGEALTVHVPGELVLRRSDGEPIATPALIIPDYEFA